MNTRKFILHVTFFILNIHFTKSSVLLRIFVGGPEYILLPLHSQVPREDQRRVFLPAPPNVTKVILSIFSQTSRWSSKFYFLSRIQYYATVFRIILQEQVISYKVFQKLKYFSFLTLVCKMHD